MNEERLEELIKKFNRLISIYNALVATLDQIPLQRTAVFVTKLIKVIGVLYDISSKVPFEVYEIMYSFLKCDDQSVVDLSAEQLKKLVEFLRALAEVELIALEEKIADLEAKGLEVPRELRDYLSQLNAWIQELERALQAKIDELNNEDAVQFVQNLKQTLKRVAPLVLAALLTYFEDDINELIEDGKEKAVDSAIRFVVVTLIKEILKKLIAKILIRFFGDAIAKKLIPYVGVGLTIGEFITILTLLEQLRNLQNILDVLRVVLINEIIALGGKTPENTDFTNLFLFINDVKDKNGGSQFLDKEVTIRPFIRCAFQEGDIFVWGDPCPLRFTDGKSSKQGMNTADTRVNGQWRYPTPIDKESIDNSTCRAGAKFCYVFLRISTGPRGKSETEPELVVEAIVSVEKL